MPSLRRALMVGRRRDTPEELLRSGRRPDTRRLVVCLGDSITQGNVSSNWVDLLDQRLRPKGFQFVNAGVNGDLAYNVAERLDEVIACRPDLITLLVGTNDVNARFDARWEAQYRWTNELPASPDLAFYSANLERILGRLRGETQARIIALDLPMLGEDLDSRMNGLIAEANAELGRVAARHGVPVLPLNAALRAALPPGHAPPPYDGGLLLGGAAMARHALGQSWDEVSRANGLALLTDHIHLNDRAAAILADLVQPHLEG